MSPIKKAYIRNGVFLKHPSERLREESLDRFTHPNPAYSAALMHSPYGYVSESIPQTIQFVHYDKEKKILHLPRGFDAETELSARSLKEYKGYHFRDKRNFRSESFPRLRLKMSREQKLLYRASMKALRTHQRPHGNILLVGHTAVGKTILQAALAAKLGQRTLVLCVTNLIRDAWLRDIYKAYGIAKKDVGLIQQSTWRIGKWFTLATIATLDRREQRWPELFAEFGTVVLDEVQHIEEPRMQRFIAACSCAYIIGATATPESDSGQNVVLPAYFGNPVKRLIASSRNTHSSVALRKVKIVPTNFQYKHDRHNLDLHDLSISLSADDGRNKLIVDNAFRDWKKGRSVLIAVKRVAHLHLLKDLLREKGVADCNVLFGGTNTNKRYTESLIRAILSRKVRMLIATIAAIKTGANFNPLSHLHLAWPCNRQDLEQLIGRIRRRDASKKGIRLIYYQDKFVPWLFRRYVTNATEVFRKLKVKGYENLYYC